MLGFARTRYLWCKRETEISKKSFDTPNSLIHELTYGRYVQDCSLPDLLVQLESNPIQIQIILYFYFVGALVINANIVACYTIKFSMEKSSVSIHPRAARHQLLLASRDLCRSA